MKKKVLLLITLFLPVMACAQICVDGIYYDRTDDGNYKVIKNPNGYDEEVTIPSFVNGIKVTEIDDEAFFNNLQVSVVNLPITIEKIGVRAFSACENIYSIEIPENVKRIDAYAFGSNPNLRDIYCYARNIVLDKDIFNKTKLKDITLYVPEANIDYFKKADQWKKIKNIVPTTTKSWAVLQYEDEIEEERAARQRHIQDSIAAVADIAAAENGDIEAQFRLGERYSKGKGVIIDKTKAIEYYKKAADNGNVDAQVHLGLIYDKGNGVSMDKKIAKSWYEKAAAQGNSEAIGYLELLRRAMGEVVFPQGFIVLINQKHIVFPDSIILDCSELEPSSFEVMDNKKSIRSANIHNITIPNSIVAKRSSKEIEKIILEKLTIAFPNHNINSNSLFGWVALPNGKTDDHTLRVRSTSGHDEIGYFKDNKYTSIKAIEAEGKNETLRVANFKKKYGFDPNSSGRQVIKVGRKIAALDAWGEWKREKYSETSLFSDMPWKYSLSIDHGESKCYDLVFNLSVKGYAWVKNGVITSVVWY